MIAPYISKTQPFQAASLRPAARISLLSKVRDVSPTRLRSSSPHQRQEFVDTASYFFVAQSELPNDNLTAHSCRRYLCDQGYDLLMGARPYLCKTGQSHSTLDIWKSLFRRNRHTDHLFDSNIYFSCTPMLHKEVVYFFFCCAVRQLKKSARQAFQYCGIHNLWCCLSKGYFDSLLRFRHSRIANATCAVRLPSQLRKSRQGDQIALQPKKVVSFLVTSIFLPLVTLGCQPMIQVGSDTGPIVQVGSNQPPATVVNNVVSSACGWDSAFYPDQKPVDYAKRWTDHEMAWLVSHNAKVAEFCPQAPVK